MNIQNFLAHLQVRGFQIRAGIVLLTVLAISSSMTFAAKPAPPTGWHMGPTGFYGTVGKNNITVTYVAKSSPADGKLNVGDVIVSAADKKMEGDIRKQIAAAINAAEAAADGALVLQLKDGKTVSLTLQKLGAYSATAPDDCKKSDAIIAHAAEHIIKNKDYGRFGFGLMGLLATGEKSHLEVVRTAIRELDWAKPDVKLTLGPEGSAWAYGYQNILLCEYYLRTKDDYVLPAINKYAVTLAKGRDAAGLWGHRMANPEANRGQLHGRLYGYAVMNSSSLPCYISLLLAQKCGVKDPELTAAIEQGRTFYGSFVGKGTLPYGVHDPNTKAFNNNGMSGMAAIALSLAEDKQGAAFFSKMSLASTNMMETGHTGHFFNQLWTGLGAGLAGPSATTAFFKETAWLHTLNRKWDGGFTYDSGENYSYSGFNDAASHLLNYCVPRHQLYINGKGADKSIFLSAADAQKIAGLATLDINKLSDEELFKLLDHEMPKVRQEAVWQLRGRPHKYVNDIVKMLTNGTALQRKSAVEYFGYQCPPDQARLAVESMAALLKDSKQEMSMRADIASSIANLGAGVHAHYSDILKLVLERKPEDKLGEIDMELGRALVTMCADPYAAGLVKDKELFYAAANKLMAHKRSYGRAAGAKMISAVPLEDFHWVADSVKVIMDDQELTYTSYHNFEPKIEAVGIYARLNIEGGIEGALAAFDSDTGKAGFKIRMLMSVLPVYGANAKYILPKVKEINPGKFKGQWDKIIADIETADPVAAKKMLKFEEAKNFGKTK
ncbi:MAG: DUF6288 domain-containing protein [Akkermansiaceae bacterium]|jgi:hypothetical protein